MHLSGKVEGFLIDVFAFDTIDRREHMLVIFHRHDNNEIVNIKDSSAFFDLIHSTLFDELIYFVKFFAPSSKKDSPSKINIHYCQLDSKKITNIQ